MWLEYYLTLWSSIVFFIIHSFLVDSAVTFCCLLQRNRRPWKVDLYFFFFSFTCNGTWRKSAIVQLMNTNRVIWITIQVHLTEQTLHRLIDRSIDQCHDLIWIYTFQFRHVRFFSFAPDSFWVGHYMRRLVVGRVETYYYRLNCSVAAG